MFDFSKARTNMVDGQVHTAGVVDPRILNAFETVPREIFVPDPKKKLAYFDEDLPIGGGRYLLEPIAHAKMLQAAHPRPDETALDVGTASGYSAAILSPLVSTVIALEQDKALLDQARENIEKLDAVNVVLVEKELTEGCTDNAPYSLIIVNGAVSEVPRALIAQLSEDGRLICVLKKPGLTMGDAVLVRKTEGDTPENVQYSLHSLFNVGCHYLPGFEPKPVFSF